MKYGRLKLVTVLIIVMLCLLNIAVYHVTYDNPIVLGDHELYHQYKEYCLSYSHTLMEDFLGIKAHAQIIHISEGDSASAEILLISLIPPSRTKVWHSEGDIPYWECGLNSYGN